MSLFADDEEPDDDFDLPEPEEIAAVGHPRVTSNLIGLEDVEAKLLDFFNSGKMPHALIFAGPKGVGKATMAYHLARFLFKQGLNDANQDSLFGAPPTPITLEISANDPIFSRVASGGHADLFNVERVYDAAKDKFKVSVEVDEIRKVAPFFRKTASEGGWRIVIIDDADTMNRNAQNALLKILEEPPANSILILIAHRPGALIPTIRSRARVIHFQAFTPDALQTLLKGQGHHLTQDEFLTLWNFSGGSFGQALELLESGGVAMAGRILDLLENYPKYDRLALHKFADSLNGEEGALAGDIMATIFDYLAKAKARGIEIEGFGVHRPLMRRIIDQSSLERLLRIGEAVKSHFNKVEFANLDKRQGILTAFSLLNQ